MTAPATRGRRWIRVIQVALVAVVVWYIWRALSDQWGSVRTSLATIDLRWSWLIASGVLVLIAHAVLVATWAAMLGTWGSRLPFWTAARIWSVSNLGKYVPGKVWQIGTMGVMALDAGVSPVAAAGSAILNTAVNITVGLAIAVIAGWRHLGALTGGNAFVGVGLLVMMVAGLASLPMIIPRLAPRLERMTGRPLGVVTIPPRAFAYAVAGNVVAWTLYGVAFQWMVNAVFVDAPGTTLDYVTAFAASYVAGYLALVLPAGVGVREAVVMEALKSFMGMALAPAAIIAAVSRLWLTVLEVIPGFLFLSLRPRR
jgi:hypothetical protein